MIIDAVMSRCVAVALAFQAGILLLVPTVLRAQESIEELAKTCATCHGENGIPQDKATPVIWGQNEGYMYLQLRDFKRGFRKNEIMQGIVKALDRTQMREFAAYFARLEWPDLRQPAPSGDETKKALTAAFAMSCTVCHQGEYQGDGTTGRVAGQSFDYLQKTAKDFRDGTRANNPGMANVFRSMEETDIVILNKYLGSLRLQSPTGGR